MFKKVLDLLFIKLSIFVIVLLGYSNLEANQKINLPEAFSTKPLVFKFMETSPPVASVTGYSAVNSTQSKYRWANIEIITHTKKVDRFLDDITMDVEIGLILKPINNVKQAVIFTGQINYWTIDLDGKDHYYTALLPGKLFNRYAINNSTPKNSDLYIGVKFSHKGLLLAEGYYSVQKNASEARIKNWFENVRKGNAYNVIELKDSVLGRLDSSWGVIEIDKYEYEKKK